MDEIRFIFKGKTFIVVHYLYGSRQPSPNGKASGRPMIIPITITVEYNEAESHHLEKWAWKSRETHDVTLDFIKGGQTVRQFQIIKAIATNHRQVGNFKADMNGNNVATITEEITLMCEEINDNNKAKLKRSSKK